MNVREDLLKWMDQFENDHYVFDIYGETVSVDLPREKVEKIMDISIRLLDSVVAAQKELKTSEYIELENSVRKKYSDDSKWLFYVVIEAVVDEHLFGRYREVEQMIREMEPRGYPMDSAAHLLTVRPEIDELIYAVIRNVDIVKENYKSLVYTFFLGVLTKGWSKGFGWYITEDGTWAWTSKKIKNERHLDVTVTSGIGAGITGKVSKRAEGRNGWNKKRR